VCVSAPLSTLTVAQDQSSDLWPFRHSHPLSLPCTTRSP
jgi:hypothetical protein